MLHLQAPQNMYLNFLTPFVDHLQFSLGKIDLHLTPEMNWSGQKNQKDKTVYEQSILGFSHYKTSFLDLFLNKIDIFLRDTPFSLGFSPTSCRKKHSFANSAENQCFSCQENKMHTIDE